MSLTKIRHLLDDYNDYGRYLHLRCLFHDDQHPSMFIYEDKYICASCGAWGYTASLVEKLSSFSVIQKPIKLKPIGNPFSNWLLSMTLPELTKTAYQHAKRKCPKYLEKRGITDLDIYQLKLGFLEDYIVIPIRDRRGFPLGAIARSADTTSSSRYFMPKGQSTDLLYIPDYDMLDKSMVVFLTFGVFDAISLWKCGFPAISTTGGKRLSIPALDNIRKKIIFIPDHEEIKDAKKIASKLGWRGSVLEISYPYKTKDLNDLYIKDNSIIKEVIHEYMGQYQRTSARIGNQ